MRTCDHCEQEMSEKFVVAHLKRMHMLKGPGKNHSTAVMEIIPRQTAQTEEVPQEEQAAETTPVPEGQAVEDIHVPEVQAAQDVCVPEDQAAEEMPVSEDQSLPSSSQEDEGVCEQEVSEDREQQQDFELPGNHMDECATLEENEQENNCYVVILPRFRHSEPKVLEAMQAELEKFRRFDAYEVIDRPTDEKVITTNWVCTQKDKDGILIMKARLRVRGDLEANVQDIACLLYTSPSPRDS